VNLAFHERVEHCACVRARNGSAWSLLLLLLLLLQQSHAIS
jgi:hypothetical protein